MTLPPVDIINQNNVPSLKKAVFYSILAHILLILFVIFSPMLPWNLMPEEKPLDIVWVELPKGTGEDITGIRETQTLPQTTIQESKEIPEEKTPPTPPPQKVVVKKQPPVDTKKDMLEPTKKDQKKKEPRVTYGDAAMRKALAKIDKELKKSPEAAQTGSGSGEGYKFGTGDKPLRISRGDPAYLRYQAQVRAKIMGNWIAPGRYTSGESVPTARVHVTISASGQVLSTRWVRRSGDSSFDESALRAISRASPFPVPPEELKWEALNEGFLVEFDIRRARR